jgi:membrane protease YdiL (CAAX protease family)
LQIPSNALIDRDFRPISGWTILLFGVVLVIAAVGAVFALRGMLLGDQDKLLVIGVLYAVGLFSIAVAVAPMGRAALPALAIRGANWRPVLFGILGTLALSIGASQVGPELKGMEEVQDLVRQPGALVTSLLFLGVLAPLVEELVFRGLLYGWLEGRWGWRLAFVVSSLAFALAHYQWQATGWSRLAYAAAVLPLGLLFGYLRRRTNSLLPSFAAHVANNSFAVLAAAFLDI